MRSKQEERFTISSEPAPTWTLSAAHRFDILALVYIVGLAKAGKLGEIQPHRMREMEERLREFELYEERHHG